MNRSGANVLPKRFRSAQQQGGAPRALLIVVLALAALALLFPEQAPAGPRPAPTRPLSAHLMTLSAPMLIFDDAFVIRVPEFGGIGDFDLCDEMRSKRRSKLQSQSSSRPQEFKPDRRRQGTDSAYWSIPSVNFVLSCRIKSARLFIVPNSLLRISTGEWVPRPRAFAGKQRYLDAVRSFLHPHGDLERMRARAA